MSAPSIVRQAVSSFHLIAGIVLLGVSGTLLTIASSLFLQERAYRTGQQADATVTRKYLRPATADSSTAYELTYRVRSPDLDWEMTSAVAPAVWESLQEGSTIRVQYLAGDPASLRVAQDSKELLLGAIAAVMAPLAVLGLWLLGRGGRDVWRRMRLYRHGRPAEAIVTAVRETNLSINRQIQWAIDFAFPDHLGQTQRGTSTPMPAWQALEWKEGDKGMVRFDPSRPADSVWLGEEVERTSS